MSGRQKGFTLIELLVVISIIGVLSTIAMTSLNGAKAKARDAKRLSDITQIKTALDIYYADHGHYPSTGSNLYYFMRSGLCGGEWTCHFNGKLGSGSSGGGLF